MDFFQSCQSFIFVVLGNRLNFGCPAEGQKNYALQQCCYGVCLPSQAAEVLNSLMDYFKVVCHIFSQVLRGKFLDLVLVCLLRILKYCSVATRARPFSRHLMGQIFWPINPLPHIEAFWHLCSRLLFENIVTKEEIAQN